MSHSVNSFRYSDGFGQISIRRQSHLSRPADRHLSHFPLKEIQGQLKVHLKYSLNSVSFWDDFIKCRLSKMYFLLSPHVNELLRTLCRLLGLYAWRRSSPSTVYSEYSIFAIEQYSHAESIWKMCTDTIQHFDCFIAISNTIIVSYITATVRLFMIPG